MATRKKPRIPVVRIQQRYRITAWISADELHKLELALIERRRQTGRPVEHGEIIGECLREKYSGLYLGDRRTAPAPPVLAQIQPESVSEPAA